MNGNKYENIQLSIGSCNSYLGALTFLSNSLKKLSSKKWKSQNTEEIPKLDIHSIICNITSVWYLVNAMSRPRKQRILGIYIYFNLALGLFRKVGNVLVRISMSPIIIISSSFAEILQKNFLKFFSFVFLLIFPLFAVSSNKTNLLRIYLEYLGKKKTNKQTNKQTNQQSKTKSS